MDIRDIVKRLEDIETEARDKREYEVEDSIGRLIENYLLKYPHISIIGYLNGYKGLLLGKSISFPNSIAKDIKKFYQFGGTPIGNSRVKLTNIDDCIKNNRWR